MSESIFPRFPAKGLLFDLDGTLIDSVPDIAHAANKTLVALGRTPADISDLRQWVGNGAATLIKRALTGKVDGEPEPKLLETALPIFFDRYAERVFVESRLYPGVEETLHLLKERGYKIACVTNKPMRHTSALLQQTGLQSLFDCVVAGDTVTKRKPDPLPLIHACQQMALYPEDGIMIGDSINDIQAAKSANMPVVCLTYGYNQGVDLSRTGVDILIDRFTDLVELLLTPG